jgi:UDP-N-acetylglucosamine transferase subunit ALG13
VTPQGGSSPSTPRPPVETAVEAPLVVVTVGTDHHRFDRLVRWMDHWYSQQPGEIRVVAQTGTAQQSRVFPCQPYLAPGDLEEAVGAATAVVSHGGPATIMGVRSLGLMPIVVPRDARLDEHVDDHQQRFARWLAARGEIALATTEAELCGRLDAAIADPTTYRLAASDVDPTAHTVERFGALVDQLLERRR